MKKPSGPESGSTNAELLLPWYATGKLDASARTEVENALERSPELRMQLDLIRHESRETVASHEAMAMPQSDATKTFMAMIQKEAPPRTAGLHRFGGFMEWLSLQLSGPPRWAVAAAVMAIIVQSTLLGGFIIERQTGIYHTASGGGETRIAGTLVLVRFADSATLGDLGKRLAALDIAIVDGPKAGGLFTLRIGPENMPAAERSKKTAELQANADLVMFVGPVQ
jgi:hypothetical protein